MRHPEMSLKRAHKLLLPTLILVELALVSLDVLQLEQAVAVVVAVELAASLLALYGLWTGIRRFRSSRALGTPWWVALEETLGTAMPDLAARAIVLEIRMWAHLLGWLLGRRPRGPQYFSYHRRSFIPWLLLLVVVELPVEVVLAELFVPWGWLRWTLLLLSIYGLIWVLGLHASLVMLPHVLEDDRLLVRSGIFLEGAVRYADVAQLEVGRFEVKGRREGFYVDPSGRSAWQLLGGRADVRLRLASPTSFRRALRRTPLIETLHLSVDEPERFAQALRGKLREFADS